MVNGIIHRLFIAESRVNFSSSVIKLRDFFAAEAYIGVKVCFYVFQLHYYGITAVDAVSETSLQQDGIRLLHGRGKIRQNSYLRKIILCRCLQEYRIGAYHKSRIFRQFGYAWIAAASLGYNGLNVFCHLITSLTGIAYRTEIVGVLALSSCQSMAV